MKRHVFLTGATGYIGSHLLRKWPDALPGIKQLFLPKLRRDTGLVAPPVREYFAKMAVFIRQAARPA